MLLLLQPLQLLAWLWLALLVQLGAVRLLRRMQWAPQLLPLLLAMVLAASQLQLTQPGWALHSSRSRINSSWVQRVASSWLHAAGRWMLLHAEAPCNARQLASRWCTKT